MDLSSEANTDCFFLISVTIFITIAGKINLWSDSRIHEILSYIRKTYTKSLMAEKKRNMSDFLVSLVSADGLVLLGTQEWP